MDFYERVKAAITRVDGWVNLMTGVGADRRSKRLTFAADGVLDDSYLEQLYIGDPYANRICRVLPEEALRQGYKVKTGDPGEESALAELVTARSINERLLAAWVFARVFGGAAIFVGADDGQDPELPLREDAIKSVRFLTVLDRRELQPNTYYAAALGDQFGDVETYRVTRSSNAGVVQNAVVHETRLIRFQGALATRRRRQVLKGWGESELQRIYNVLAHFNGAFEATGALMQQSSQGVFAMKNLMAMMAADKRDVLKTRLEMMDLARGLTNSVLVDADGESYTRTEVGALTGVSDLLKMDLLFLSGAAEIPVIVLMGQSPAGFSSGDGDMRWFYDRTRSAQLNQLQPRHLRLLRLLCLAKDGPTGGKVPAKLSIEYATLWQPTPLEQAQIRQAVATSDGLYIDKQVVTPEEVALSRFRPEGFSTETLINLGARQAAAAVDATAPDEIPPADALNGAQVTSLLGIIQQVALGAIPRATAVQVVSAAFSLTPERADEILGEVGRDFVPKVGADGKPLPPPTAAPGAAAAEGAAPPGGEHAQSAGDIIARVTSREIPRTSGVALMQSSLGMSPEAAEAAMGEAGRSVFSTPAPTDTAAHEATKGENAKLKRQLQGHQQYTARVIAAAREKGVSLAAFAASEPTVVAGPDELAPGVAGEDPPAAPPAQGASPAPTEPPVP